MIFLYTGKTGSGKTFQMAKDVYPLWLSGQDIYSNTKLYYENFGGAAGTNILDNPENFTIWEKCVNFIAFKWSLLLRKDDFRPKRRGHITYFDDITELIEIRDGVIMMDEAQNLLDARNWENLPLEFSNKLRQHRKHNLDLFATTQSLGTIDRNMRRLVQKWSHCSDIFALFGLRNPSLFTIHKREYKDIDKMNEMSGLDAMTIETIKETKFYIHRWKKRYYDTLYDIGFNAYKMIWLQQTKRKICLILPKQWTLSNARTQSLLMKFYLDQTNSRNSSKPLKTYAKSLMD